MAFIQAGTGAVTRTEQDKMRETVSVKDYGAVGDGVADDTTAFVNGLNYLAGRPNRGLLYVPAGTYRLLQALALPAGVGIVGDGATNSMLTFAGAGAGTHGITMLHPINSSTQTFSRIERLRITGPGSASTGFGVYDQGGTEWILRDCFVEDWKYGLVMDQSEIVTVANCDFDQCNKAGIWLVNGAYLVPGASGGFTNRITIRECQFNSCGLYSIIDDGGVDHVLRDNNYNYATTAHLRAAGVTKLLVQGGEWEGAPINVLLRADAELGGGVGQNAAVCLQSNDFTQPGGTAAVKVESSCAALTLLANTFGNMGKAEALIKGVGNVVYLFSAGNIFYEHTNAVPGATFLDGRALLHNVIETLSEAGAAADIGALAAGASGYANITVGGARLGDFVESVSADPDLGDQVEVTARVSATDTVRVRVRNIGSTSVDPAPATFRIRLHRRSI